jgi:hypothetical protein
MAEKERRLLDRVTISDAEITITGAKFSRLGAASVTAFPILVEQYRLSCKTNGVAPWQCRPTIACWRSIPGAHLGVDP